MTVTEWIEVFKRCKHQDAEVLFTSGDDDCMMDWQVESIGESGVIAEVYVHLK